MKTLLRSQIERDLARLEQRVQAFVRQLADFVQIEVLNQQDSSVLPSAAQLRRLAHRRAAADHAVSRLPGRQLRHRSRTRSSARGRSLRARADDERGHRRDAATGARCAAQDPGELLRRHGMDAASSRQGSQGSEQAPPSFQHLEDRLHLAVGQRPTEDESARCPGRRVEAGRHRESWRLPASPGRRSVAGRLLADDRPVWPGRNRNWTIWSESSPASSPMRTAISLSKPTTSSMPISPPFPATTR